MYIGKYIPLSSIIFYSSLFAICVEKDSGVTLAVVPCVETRKKNYVC